MLGHPEGFSIRRPAMLGRGGEEGQGLRFRV